MNFDLYFYFQSTGDFFSSKSKRQQGKAICDSSRRSHEHGETYVTEKIILIVSADNGM